MMKGSCKRPMNITMLDSDDTVYCIGITRAGAFLPVCLSIGTERKVLMLVVPEEITKFAAVRVHTAKARPDNLRRRISKAVKDDYDSIFRRGYSEGQAAVARPIGENR